MNEAETRAELIDPALRTAGWGVVQDSRVRRETLCPGRIEGAGRRGLPEIADYVLTFRNHKLAVIEAKAEGKGPTEGVGQAKAYAEKLQARLAFSTNGRRIYRMDMETGEEGYVERYPTPDELWAEVFRAPNEWRDRFAAVEPQTGPVDWAFRTIVAGNGQIRIADVARDIGWSRKHLLQRFRQQIGIGPKAVSRMVRFNHAVGLARQRQADGWADIAVECGYADQAHMVREFRAFAGSTPSTLPFLAS